MTRARRLRTTSEHGSKESRTLAIGPRVNDAILAAVAFEHRFDPWFRDAFDALFQRPLADIVQFLVRSTHDNPETRLCQEIPLPNEQELAAAVTEQMKAFTVREYTGKVAERAGNTKTYGVVRGEFVVRDDVPAHLRHGVFRAPARYPAWVRFAGPGPLAPPDIEDAGILSLGIKLTGVPGPKLLDDEQHTQDFLGISAPTFTTPNVAENVKLQRAVYAGTPTFYFLDPRDSHVLDMLMQGLFARMHGNPLEARYWSCVPFLCGDGQAIKYAVRPHAAYRTRVPWNPPADWLRQAMAATLAARDVEFDFLVQVQTDPRRMPIEDASVEWPERLSPFVPVARLVLPRQQADFEEQLRMARELSFNPWHAVPEHRPLGNQNRARRLIYTELSRLRQSMNNAPHVEPAAAAFMNSPGQGA